MSPEIPSPFPSSCPCVLIALKQSESVAIIQHLIPVSQLPPRRCPSLSIPRFPCASPSLPNLFAMSFILRRVVCLRTLLSCTSSRANVAAVVYCSMCVSFAVSVPFLPYSNLKYVMAFNAVERGFHWSSSCVVGSAASTSGISSSSSATFGAGTGTGTA